jgi:hypothetical protein
VLGVVVGGLVGGTDVDGAGGGALSCLGAGPGGGCGAAAAPGSAASGTGAGGVGAAAGRSAAAAEAGGTAGSPAAVVTGALVFGGDFDALPALRIMAVTPAKPTTKAATHATIHQRRVRRVSPAADARSSAPTGGAGSSDRGRSRVAAGTVTLAAFRNLFRPKRSVRFAASAGGRSGYRPTARSSCRLVILDRPLMFFRRASS